MMKVRNTTRSQVLRGTQRKKQGINVVETFLEEKKEYC